MSRELLGVEWDIPRALLVGLVVATLLGLVVAASTSSAAFGLYNPDWEGTSELRTVADETDTETTVLRNVSEYRTADGDAVAVVLAPDRNYTDREAAAIRGFLQRGGTLLVAEDVGTTGNQLLDAVGASTRVNGTLLRDERRNYRSPAMPVATNVTANETLTRGVGRLTLNYASTVEPGANATVLVRSSGFAYLDENGNEQLDDSERLASRPVATVEPVGAGRVVVVSDPSVFINAMLERSGNRRFARNLLGSEDRLLLDFSHTADLPPLSLALVVVRNSPLLQALVGCLSLAVVGAWGAGLFGGLAGLRRRLGGDRAVTDEPPVSEADLLAYLRNEHPEWDSDRVRRIAQGISTERRNEREDD